MLQAASKRLNRDNVAVEIDINYVQWDECVFLGCMDSRSNLDGWSISSSCKARFHPETSGCIFRPAKKHGLSIRHFVAKHQAAPQPAAMPRCSLDKNMARTSSEASSHKEVTHRHRARHMRSKSARQSASRTCPHLESCQW